MSRRIHGLFLPIVFPSGVAPGEGGDYNALTIARNGAGNPVLRGTALAGAVRHAWRRLSELEGISGEELDEEVKEFFGYALGDDDLLGGVESRLQVSDCMLHIGDAIVTTRTHHLRNRHDGTVAAGGLYSLEACPPGTTTSVALWLRDDDDTPEGSRAFLQTLIGLIATGLPLGGKSARGVGMALLNGEAVYRVYELNKFDEYAAWLDDHRAWRLDPMRIPTGHELCATPAIHETVLEVRVCLGIPRGQDILVGDGQGLDHEIEPQRIVAADGKQYWRLPGASLRGLFRGWIARLAARDGQPVADHAERQQLVRRGELDPETNEYNGKNLGWCFLPKAERKHGLAKTDCSVARLFGSLFQAGKFQVSDGFAPCSASIHDGACAEEQLRTHVAVDRITGGAAEGMLFENTVLTAYSDGTSPRFEVTVRIESPQQNEARWLAKTLQALDLGILRVGSSKSSGRLALTATPQASGPWAEYFTAIKPTCVIRDSRQRARTIEFGGLP